MFLLDIAFRSEKDVLSTEFPRLGFELLLLRLVNAPGLLDVEALEAAARPATPAVTAGGDTYPKSKTTYAGRPSGPKTESSPESSSVATAKRDAPAGAKADSSPVASAKAEIWDTLLKNLGAKKKTVLLSLLSQMKGWMEGEALIISSPHQFVLDRLREEDKWPVLLQAVSEAAGKKLEVRLSASSGEKKRPEPASVGKGESRTEKRALSDPLLTEFLREFEGATVLEIRPAPRKEPVPGAPEAEEPAPDESEEEL
jgi:DNA polymerase III gamma/tau subunit